MKFLQPGRVGPPGGHGRGSRQMRLADRALRRLFGGQDDVLTRLAPAACRWGEALMGSRSCLKFYKL
jgi:hypothetical protein